MTAERSVSSIPYQRPSNEEQTVMAQPTASTDYTAAFATDAVPAAVYEALTNPAAILAWWTAWVSVSGSGDEGGTLRFTFGAEDQMVAHVDAARPTVVAWSVEGCAVLPDWVGTRPTFTMRPAPNGGTEISFHHVGLSPALECYDTCQKGWDQYLPSLRGHLEPGAR